MELLIDRASFSYGNGRVVDGASLSVSPGEMVALLGPNGSGKTTLLKLASGILKPARGNISLGGASLTRLDRKSIARTVAVLPQQFQVPFAYTVAEIVMLGRTPYIRTLSGETAVDKWAVAAAIDMVGIGKLAGRYFDQLSGGERQKVVLAMALAQQPRLLLLDEPTVHLDISQQVEILELVRRLNREQGMTVLAAMHDLNLAALYFDRLVLLRRGRVFAAGAPGRVITPEIIQEVFGARVRVETDAETGAPHVVVLPDAARRELPL